MPTLRACQRCGEHIVVGDRFCAHCGAEQPITLAMGGADQQVSRWEEIGRRLQAATEGRYHIRGLVGRGGMAAVYLADWPQMELRVAIKVMDPYLLDHETFVPRFLQEARTIARLKHRHIIRVYDSGTAEDLYYFCMDYYPGRSLEKVLETEGPLPIPVIKVWLSQAADALGYAHRQPKPVIHRDVKPSNMLLDHEGDVVLTDFGIAKVRDLEHTLRSPTLTRPGAVLGTPAYISPEQALVILDSEAAVEGGQATAASDQYSLGVVAYEMLCGEPPFTGALAPLCMAHAEKEPEDILEKRPDCPPDLAKVVMRMLEKKPDQRWSGMEKVHAALSASAAPAGSPLRIQLSGYAKGHQPVGSISLYPPSGEVFVGQSLRLNATPLDLVGRPLPDRLLSWKSSHPDVALVSGKGILQALRPGPVSITASSEGVSGELRLSVSEVSVDTVVVLPGHLTIPVGEERQLRVLLLSGDGAHMEDRETSWTSADPQIASVKADGTVRALALGTTSVSVASEGHTGKASVAVVPKPVASVRINPRVLTIQVGEESQLACIPRDLDGERLRDRSITWSTDDPSVVDLREDGVVRGLEPGLATISASCDGAVGAATVSVKPEPVFSVELSPALAFLARGETAQLVALPRSARGNELPGRAVLWESSNATVAKVDGAGKVRGLREGSARITAICDQALACAEVTVTGAPHGSIAVTPDARSIPVDVRLPPPGSIVIKTRKGWVEENESRQLRAVVLGEDGRELEEAQVRWESGDPSVAKVDRQGRVRGLAPGTVQITASYGEVSNAVALTVRPGRRRALIALRVAAAASVVGVAALIIWRIVGPGGQLTSESPETVVAAIAIVPGDRSSLIQGETQELEIRAQDQAGNPIPRGGIPPIQWETGDGAVVSVTEAGLLTALRPGTARVTASLTLAEGTPPLESVISVTVAGEPAVSLAGVEIRGPTSILEGASVQLSAVALDSAGAEVSGMEAAWRSSDPAVANLTGRGVTRTLRALQPGTVDISATVGEVEGMVRIEISPRPAPAEPTPAPEPTVTEIRLEPPQGELLEGATLQLHLLDQSGAAVEGEFMLDDTLIATVSGEGLLAAHRAGVVNLTATFEALITRGRFRVNPRVVEPSRASLDSVRVSLNEAESQGRLEEFDAAYRLLDLAGDRIAQLREQAPGFQPLAVLYGEYLRTYRELFETCDAAREVDIERGVEDPPECKPPPTGGGGDHP